MGDLSEHFSASEFACSCGCGYGTRPGDVSEDLIWLLENIRGEYGPIRVNSGCRCAAYNASIGGVANSAHTIGQAADIGVSGGKRRRLVVNLAVLYGASGLGVAKTFIHVDVAEDECFPGQDAGRTR